MPDKKVVIIGIDGGTFDIIGPMIERGELPHIASLVKSGVSSDLQSTIPPITAPAWTSFMTGTAPGKHGIFNFIGDTHKTYSGRVLSASDSRSQTVWSHLSQAGKRLMLLNIPFTYPPVPVNGIMVSGMGAPEGNDTITYPRAVYRELLDEFGSYKVDQHIGEVFSDRGSVTARADALIANLRDMEIKRTNAALYLLEKYEWDIFMVVYVMTDRLQHLFWRFMDASHPGFDPQLALRYEQAIADGYRTVDAEMGRILNKTGEDATVIVMSDHGFGPLHKCFYINSWLVQNGLMTLRQTLPWKFQAAALPVGRLLDKLGMGGFSKFLSRKTLTRTIPAVRRVRKRWDELVDWSRTKAYAADPLGVSINLRGREPHGIVDSRDRERLSTEIAEKLMTLKDPETDDLVVDDVTKSSDAYSGPAASEAPDLLLSLKGLSYLPYPHRFNAKRLFEPPQNEWSGTHRYNGVFIMKGPGIKQSVSLTGIRIIDIAPTVLHLFQQPVPEATDGSVIQEAFYQEVLEANPVIYGTAKGNERKMNESLSETDEQKVRNHLESLGYL